MNLNEYYFYSEIATKLFNYMNGKINTMNSNCILYIDMHDYVYRNYATIRYPNHIFLHIGNAVDGWNDEWGYYIAKEEYVATIIAWALAHELHHADQAIQMVRYQSNRAYKDEKENDVQRASYDWVDNHSYELSNLIGINIKIDYITCDNLTNSGSYRKASVGEFYKQTIANTVLKDLQLFNKLTFFCNDSESDDIVIMFNSGSPITIKRNGHYLMESVNVFSESVYNNVAFFDAYTIHVDVESFDNDGKRVTVVNFTIENPLYHPMVFKNNK